MEKRRREQRRIWAEVIQVCEHVFVNICVDTLSFCGLRWELFQQNNDLNLFCLSNKCVRSDAAKTGFTWETSSDQKRKLEGTGTNPTDTESKDKNSMSPQEEIDNL